MASSAALPEGSCFHQPACPLLSEERRPGRWREAHAQGPPRFSPEPEHPMHRHPEAAPPSCGLASPPPSPLGVGRCLRYFSSPDSRELLHLTPYWIKEGVTWGHSLPLAALCQGRELRCPRVREGNKGIFISMGRC